LSRLWAILLRATLADVFVLVAVIALGSAFLLPTWRARAFRERVDAAIVDIDRVSASARRILTALDRWPTETPAGEAPPELADLSAFDSPFGRTDYAIRWQTWLVVDSIEVPPEPLPPSTPGDPPRQPPGPRTVPVERVVGGVRLSTSEDALLAELAEHYGAASFVLDSALVVILPERAAVGDS